MYKAAHILLTELSKVLHKVTTSFMPPKRTTASGPRRNCIHCGQSYSVQGITSHEQRYCEQRPQVRTPDEQAEANAFAMLVQDEINRGMNLLLFI